MDKFVIGMTINGIVEKAVLAENASEAADKVWEEAQFGDAYNVEGHLRYAVQILQGCYESLKVPKELVTLVKERLAAEAPDVSREVFSTVKFADGRIVEIVILREAGFQSILVGELLDNDEAATILCRTQPHSSFLGEWCLYNDQTEYKLTVELEEGVKHG